MPISESTEVVFTPNNPTAMAFSFDPLFTLQLLTALLSVLTLETVHESRSNLTASRERDHKPSSATRRS